MQCPESTLQDGETGYPVGLDQPESGTIFSISGLRRLLSALVDQGVDTGNQHKGDQGGCGESTNHSPGERCLCIGTFSNSQCERQQSENGGQGCHEDGPEATTSGLEYSLPGPKATGLQLARLIHQENRIVDDNASQHDAANGRLQIERGVSPHEGKDHPIPAIGADNMTISGFTSESYWQASTM
jgi:hypothetical protein